MAVSSLSIANFAIGPSPDNRPGALLVITLSDNTTIPVFLPVDQAKDMSKRLLEATTAPTTAKLPQFDLTFLKK